MNPMIDNRRLGIFIIPYVLINDLPDRVKKMLEDCLILGAKRDNELEYISYLAINDKFEEVKFGEPIPFYYPKQIDSLIIWTKCVPRTESAILAKVFNDIENTDITNEKK